MRKTILAILILCMSALAASGQISVTGVVLDENQRPLPGAAVFLDAANGHGTITDAEGRFRIVVPSTESILRFEFMGYTTVKMMVGKKTVLSVTMTPDLQYLDEVVVIGFGETKKSDLTGSVASVSMEKVLTSPTLSVDQALQGRIAGADIVNMSGDPTAGTTINIRGSRSINASNEPLIIVDGVMNAVTSLADLSTSDIESISVLKDASSTAIYGAQGANGVIIVTTKTGENSTTKANVNFSVKAGFSQLLRSLDLMNATEFARYNNERQHFNKTASPEPGTGYNPNYVAYPNKYTNPEALGEGTDWIDAMTYLAPYQQYSLSVNGGVKNTNYYASINYSDNQGIIYDTGGKHLTAKVNVSHQFTKWLKLIYSHSSVYRKLQQNKANIGGTSIWNGVIYLSPALTIDDTVNDLYDYGNGVVFNNPYITVKQAQKYTEINTSFNMLIARITPMKGLTIESKNSVYLAQNHQFRFNPGSLPAKAAANAGGDAFRSEQDQRQFSSDNTVTYKTSIDKKHNLDVMGGLSIYYNNKNYVGVTAKGLLVDALTWNDLSGVADKDNYTISSSNTKVKRMSVLARANYNFKNRYYITFTGRADGSSNFAANKKWGFFPSAAFKWNMSKEQWIRQLNFFQDLSLRMSAGRTGNDAIAAYTSLYSIDSSTSGYLIGGSQVTYYYPNRLASPNLTWETTDMFNAAVDMAMFRGRLKFTLEGYYALTKDLLLNVQKAQHTGFDYYRENLGKTSNAGLELSIESKNYVKKDFSWTTEFTLAHNSQMVRDIGTEDFVVTYKGEKDYMMYGYVKGYPLNALWGFQYGGVWKSAKEIEENKITRQYGDFYSDTKAGRPRYVDQNHDGVINNDDLVYLGNADPAVYGGLQNTFYIYGVNLSLYFTYSLGGKIYNYSEFFMTGSYATNQYRYMEDRWHPLRNPDSDIPAAGGTGYSMLPSSFMVHDASYLRFKNINVSYAFDLKQITKKHLKKLTLGFSIDNVCLLTKYNGFDPDVATVVNTDTDEAARTLRRADVGAYPQARKYIFSATLNF